MNITIGLNAETLTALNALTAAISGIGAGVPAAASAATVTEKASAPTKTEVKTETKQEEKPVTIYWFSSASGEVGVVESEDEFKALKKADAKVVKIPETKYQAKLAEIEAAKNAASADDEEVPTEQDVIDAFSAYLPSDLDKDERAVRAGFVKPLLARFGAKKASELPEEHRKLAINLVQRKAAGQDIDPETDEFEDFDADEDSLV